MHRMLVLTMTFPRPQCVEGYARHYRIFWDNSRPGGRGYYEAVTEEVELDGSKVTQEKFKTRAITFSGIVAAIMRAEIA